MRERLWAEAYVGTASETGAREIGYGCYWCEVEDMKLEKGFTTVLINDKGVDEGNNLGESKDDTHWHEFFYNELCLICLISSLRHFVLLRSVVLVVVAVSPA